MVALSEKSESTVYALSGGQRQRVALARALVNEPRVLLLDEPLAALDAHLREQMQMELKSLQTRLGTTFVMVTHDQSEALSISDRQCFGLVMGHHHERRAQTSLEAFQLHLHLLAQVGIEGGEGLVEKKNPRLVHQGTRERHALRRPPDSA